MSVLGNPLLITPEGYQISRSVRLRSSASAYLNRTLGTPTSGTTWTWSGWVKRGALGALMGLQHGYSATNNQGGIYIDSSNCLNVVDYPTSLNSSLTTTQVFRDPSAWYHIVVAVDTTQATASNRVKVHVNGVQITAFSTATYPTQNTTFRMVASGNSGSVGRYYDGTSYYLDGYLTEVNFIDGQALTPSSFGESDSVTGVWKPKKYAGTYGTNGFYLNFSDNSAATAAAIGKDNSGNGNNWTPNNISVTSGATYDSMLDVPTMWADGGNGRGNYSVSNPLRLGPGATLSSGNLDYSKAASGNYGLALATFELPTTGKWYWEITPTSNPSLTNIWYSGVSETSSPSTNYLEQSGVSCGYAPDGKVYYNGGSSTYGNTYTTNDVIGVAVDMDNGAIYFSKNGTWQNSGVPTSGASKTGAARTNLSSALLSPSCASSGSTNSFTSSWNFGQRPFAYTPPTGFKALNTQNLPDATIKKGNQYFDALTWTGDGTSPKSRTGYGFQPDLVWAKGRSASHDHALFDAVRGTGAKVLSSNSTSAENDYGLSVVSFDANGFTTQTGSLNHSYANTNGSTYVGWAWKESASAGFDIVTYSGTGAAQTVAHSLGVAPRMIIAKRRNGAQNWFVGHGSFASWSSAIEGLNTTAAVNNGATAVWNATAPTSSVFSVGTDLSASGGTYVAYLFAEVAGFSKFGSYTGNGSADGPFVYCGFRPRWVMIKPTVGTGSWQILDTARDIYNVEGNLLWANESTAETSSPPRWDCLSNGFKVRAGAGTHPNVSNEVYIYAAFAENPFKNSLAR